MIQWSEGDSSYLLKRLVFMPQQNMKSGFAAFVRVKSPALENGQVSEGKK